MMQPITKTKKNKIQKLEQGFRIAAMCCRSKPSTVKCLGRLQSIFDITCLLSPVTRDHLNPEPKAKQGRAAALLHPTKPRHPCIGTRTLVHGSAFKVASRIVECEEWHFAN